MDGPSGHPSTRELPPYVELFQLTNNQNFQQYWHLQIWVQSNDGPEYFRDDNYFQDPCKMSKSTFQKKKIHFDHYPNGYCWQTK